MFKRMKKTYNDYPSSFWVLILAVFIDSMGGYMLGPFFGYFVMSQFQVTMTEIGLMFTMFSIGAIFGGIFGGALADKIGRKPVIIFGLVSSALGSLAMPFVQTIEWFYILAAISGLLGSVGGPARGALLTDVLPPEKRAEGFGVFRVAFNVSATVGPILGGMIFGLMGNYILLFVIDAISSIITAVIVFIKIPETRPDAKPKVEEKAVEQVVIQTDGSPLTEKKSFLHTMKGYFQVLGDRVFMFYVGVVALMSLVYIQINSTLGVFLFDVYEVPPQIFGFIISVNAILVVFFQFWISRKTRKFPPMIMIGVGMALYAVGFGMYGIITEVWMFFAAMVVITFGEMLIAPHAQAMIGNFAPEDKRGRYMAIGSFSWIVPSLFGVVVSGYIMDTFDPRILWLFVFGVGVLAVVGFMVLHKITKKRFAEIQLQQEQQRTPPLEVETVGEIIAESKVEIKSTSEELPEVEIKS